VGRIETAANSRLFVAMDGLLTLRPPSSTDSILLAMSSSLENSGVVTFGEVSEINAGLGTVTNNGRLVVSRNVSMTSRLGLTGASAIEYGARSDTDFGVLKISQPGDLTLTGTLRGVSEGGYSPAGSRNYPMLLATGAGRLTGTFSSVTCVGLGATCDAIIQSDRVIFQSDPGSGGAPIGAIVGGVIGGILLIALIFIIIWLVRKKKSSKVKENVDLPNPAFDPTAENEKTMDAPKSPKSPKVGSNAGKIRSESISGDPNAAASLSRVAVTSANVTSPN
jgi:hypothetical protein